MCFTPLEMKSGTMNNTLGTHRIAFRYLGKGQIYIALNCQTLSKITWGWIEGYTRLLSGDYLFYEKFFSDFLLTIWSSNDF